MKRAWTLLLWALPLVFVATGCEQNMLGPSQTEPEAQASVPPTSGEGIDATAQPSATGKDTPGLAQEIEQSYATRSPAGQAGQPFIVAPQPAAGPQPATTATRPAGTPQQEQITYVPIGVGQHTGQAASPVAPSAGPNPTMATRNTLQVELIDIRPVARPRAKKPESPTPANTPADTTEPSESKDDITTMITELEQAVREHPEELDNRLRLGLLYLVTGQEDKLAATTDVGDPVQSELLAALLKTVTNSKSVLEDPASESAEALLAVEELRRLLSQRSEVMIPKLALITKVRSFGDYDAISPPRFPQGEPIDALVYVEIANFRSKPTTDSKLLTHLSVRADLFNTEGQSIWQQAESEVEDRVSSPRRDFFLRFPIRLPADTPAGEYILKVTIEDLIGNTMRQQRLTVTIED